MKKCLIVTYYAGANYGAFWQAFALGKYLKNLELDIFYLKDTLMQNMLNYGNNDYTLKKNKKLLECIEKKFNITNEKEIYDIAIFGSDQIWSSPSILNKNGQYFGRGIKAKCKIAYAPCAIGARIIKLFFKYFDFLTFNDISVRDKITQELIYKVTRKKYPIVLDPTFLISYDFIKQSIIKEKYLFIYSYSLSKTNINSIINFAKNRNLKIVVTGCYADWADYNPIVSPKEWLSLFKFAKFVITSTFHGSVFSIIFNKQFLLLGNNSKAVELLSLFNLGNNIDANSILQEVPNINYIEVENKKYLLLKESKDFLNKYINQ